MRSIFLKVERMPIFFSASTILFLHSLCHYWLIFYSAFFGEHIPHPTVETHCLHSGGIGTEHNFETPKMLKNLYHLTVFHIRSPAGIAAHFFISKLPSPGRHSFFVATISSFIFLYYAMTFCSISFISWLQLVISTIHETLPNSKTSTWRIAKRCDSASRFSTGMHNEQGYIDPYLCSTQSLPFSLLGVSYEYFSGRDKREIFRSVFPRANFLSPWKVLLL